MHYDLQFPTGEEEGREVRREMERKAIKGGTGPDPSLEGN